MKIIGDDITIHIMKESMTNNRKYMRNKNSIYLYIYSFIVFFFNLRFYIASDIQQYPKLLEDDNHR